MLGWPGNWPHDASRVGAGAWSYGSYTLFWLEFGTSSSLALTFEERDCSSFTLLGIYWTWEVLERWSNLITCASLLVCLNETKVLGNEYMTTWRLGASRRCKVKANLSFVGVISLWLEFLSMYNHGLKPATRKLTNRYLWEERFQVWSEEWTSLPSD